MFQHGGKAFRVVKAFSFGKTENDLVTGAVFSLRELSTDLKNTDFYFSNLGKITAFRGKILHKYRIQYMRIVISFFF